MITPFKLPDNKVPIKVGDDSYIYKDVYNPIEWVNGEPFRPRVETLVLNDAGTQVYVRLTDKNYRIPGGSIDMDSSYEEQAENETNEEALLGVKDLKYSGISYSRPMDRDWLKKGGDGALAYVGSINYVYVARVNGTIDKSTIEEKDLDNDMAENGKFYNIVDILLDREHMEALVNSGMVNSAVRADLLMRIDKSSYRYKGARILESSNITGKIPELYIYHGSTCKFDIFHPMSIDLGNSEEGPGWSTFCFYDREYAKRFALFRAIQKETEHLKKNPLYRCGWDLENNRPYISTVIYEETVKSLVGTPIYIYTIDATNLELGLGNDERFPECTFRKDNVPYEIRDVEYIDKHTIDENVSVITHNVADALIANQTANMSKLNRGYYARMLNRDYYGDSEVPKLLAAVNNGELKPGDDVGKYMKEHGIELKDVSYFDHLQENTTLAPTNKEMTIYLGDNRMLMSPTNYDEVFDIETVECLIPRYTQLDSTDIELYRYYMYHLNNGGNPKEVIGFCDIIDTLINGDEGRRYYVVRVYVIPRCRRLGIGDVLANYVIRYIISDLDKEDGTATMAIVHKRVSSIYKIDNWIKSKGLMKGIPADDTLDDLDVYTRVFSSIFPESVKQYEITTEGWEDGRLYFYHMVPKGADISKGITSLQYQYDHDRAAFHKNAAKYRGRLVNEWGIYPGRAQGSLTDEEVLAGINQFRGEEDGANKIYMFAFPPYKDLGDKMARILQYKDIYRIQINDKKVLKYISRIDWGYKNSDGREEQLDKRYYADVSKKEYFAEYTEDDNQRLLFSYLNHIAVVPVDGYIPKSCWTKIETPTTVDDIVEESSQQFKQKGHLRLSQFKLTKSSEGPVDKYFWETDDGEPVAAYFVENNVNGKFNWIYNLHVSSDYQGYGLGTQLVDHAVRVGRGNSLSVLTDNNIAIRMYKKYGFKIGETSEKDVKAGKNALYFMYYPSKLSHEGISAANETRLSQPVSEGTAFGNKCPKNVRLYHASTHQNLKVIDPKQESFNDIIKNKDVVYASDDPRFSACFGVNWHDDVARQGSWDNWKTVTFGVSDKVDLSQPCSMYELENDGNFTQIKTKEFVSNRSVRVKKEIKFNTGREMLDAYGVEVISLDEYRRRLTMEGTVIDLTENFELVTEEQPNLTTLLYFKATKSVKGENLDVTWDWDKSAYSPSIKEAIQAEIDWCRNNDIPLDDKRNTFNMYTLWEDERGHILGQVTVYMYGDHFDWEWETQADYSSELIEYIKDEQRSIYKHDETNFPVEESWEDNKLLKPIYIILTYTGTRFGKLITSWQKCKFSHAGLSLNSKMDKVYTFNMRTEVGEDGKKRTAQGADIENLAEYKNPKDNDDADIAVMSIFVPSNIYDMIKTNIEKIFSAVDKTRYNIGNIVNIVLNRAVETSDYMSMICSQFVDYILKSADVDISHKSSNITTPNDFYLAAQKNPNVFLLYDGKKSKYNPKSISRKVAYIRHSDKYGDVNIKHEPVAEAFTTYDPNFVKGKPLKLSSFEKTPISKQALYKFRQSELCRELRHIDDYDTGYIYTDKGKFVAVIAVDTSDDSKYNWITAVEVGKDYQGHGLAKQLLDVATKELGGNALSAHSSNKVAIDTYKKYGFKESKESKEKMKTRVFMYYGDVLTESFDAYVSELLMENVIFNQKDLLYNVDKFENGDSNILLITGLSGSGKSTLAQKYADKYGAEIIELDIFEHCYGFTDKNLHQAGEVFIEYLSNHRDLWNKLKKKELRGKELGLEIDKFVHYVISWCNSHKGKWIIEGVQIYSFLSIDEVMNYPIIILETSGMQSLIQRLRRENGGRGINIADIVNNKIPDLLKWYWEEDRALNKFSKEMKPKMRLTTENQKLLKSLNLLLEADDNEEDDEDDDEATDYTNMDGDDGDGENSNEDDDSTEQTSDGDQATDYTDDGDGESGDDNPTDYTNEVDDGDEPTGEDGESPDGDEQPSDGNTAGGGDEPTEGEGDSGEDGESTEDTGTDDDLGATDYTDSAGEGDGSEGGDDPSTTDDTSGDSTDESSDTTDTDNQNSNNRIKNYSILKDYERLYRLANEIGNTLDPIIMEKPIQNKVVTKVKENIVDIKNAIMWFVQFGMSEDYAHNLYYYEIFVSALTLNVQMLEKNKKFSEELRKKTKGKKSKGGF